MTGKLLEKGQMEFRNYIGKVCRGMSSVLKSRSLGMNAKRKLYEGIVVLTTLWKRNLEYGSIREEIDCNGDSV